MLTDEESGFLSGLLKLLKWLLMAVGVIIGLGAFIIAALFLNEWSKGHEETFRWSVASGLLGAITWGLFDIRRLAIRISEQLDVIIRRDRTDYD